MHAKLRHRSSWRLALLISAFAAKLCSQRLPDRCRSFTTSPALQRLTATSGDASEQSWGWRRAVGARQRLRGPLSVAASQAAESPRPRKTILDLEVGEELDGIVNAVRPFGCFVDVGADKDGLVHISRISTDFIPNIDDVVRAGQEVKVWVEKVDKEQERLSLTMLPPGGVVADAPASPSRALSAFEEISPEEWLQGTVQSFNELRIYVAVKVPGEPGRLVQGTVHISNIRDGFVDHPAQEVEIGEKVKVRVLPEPLEEGRLELSMRELVTQPTGPTEAELELFAACDPTEWLPATVVRPTAYGAIVTVKAPGRSDLSVQGFVPISEMANHFVRHPSDEVKPGQRVQVRVDSLDAGPRKLQLSMIAPKKAE